MWKKEQYRIFKTLRRNKSLVITKHDKGSGIVILLHQDYVNTMMTSLKDTSKFAQLGPIDKFELTLLIEVKFQNA